MDRISDGDISFLLGHFTAIQNTPNLPINQLTCKDVVSALTELRERRAVDGLMVVDQNKCGFTNLPKK
jgi:hypothetical protein